MDSYTIESFIQWCNNTTIAEEGIKDIFIKPYTKEKDKLKSTFKSETNKVWNVIVDKFYSYYKDLGFTGKKNEVANAIIIDEASKNIDSHGTWYSVLCDIKSDFRKKVHDDHVPSVTIYLDDAGKYRRSEIYFDG